ncbi:MAG: indolepyruvate oxidoreductase subunit beta, partial [Clostridiales bacterium]|nr:indolepyruvate oxidoreductase subunit beta [Clostridiales bacterium]
MSQPVFDLVIVGVGGQGTLLASKILGKLALTRGLGVKVSEVHGMSQRGGSVITHVRVGENVHAPLVAMGNADYLLSFEALEAARAAG